MRKLLLAWLFIVCIGSLPVIAQSAFTEEDAIAFTVQQPPFALGLQSVEDWTAAAYDTGNRYGIWRVQFWNSDGDEIAWANVSLTMQRLFDYEAYLGASDDQRNAAEPIIREYLYVHPDLLMLLGDPRAFAESMWVDYNPWVQAWGVWIEQGDESLYVLVQFDGKTVDALENPQLISIGFPNVLSYTDWEAAMHSQVVALAFRQPQVAAALRDTHDWQASVERRQDGLWEVTFTSSGQTLVQATVDLTQQIVSINEH